MNKSILIVACGVALGASAQNLSTEIDVERTVDVRETIAAPLSSVTPSILPNPYTPQPLAMSEYTLSGVPGVMTDTLPPADATGIPGVWPYRGYAAVGYLPTFNVDIRAGYALVSNSSSHLDAGIRYTGESHTGAFGADGNKIKASDNNFALTLRGMHRINNVMSLTGNGSYEHYAISSPLPDTGAGKLSRGADGASIRLNVTGKHFIEWQAGIHSQYMGFSKSLKESESKPSTFIIGADARAEYSLSDMAAVELSLNLDNLHRGGETWYFPDEILPVYEEISQRNSTVGSFTPAFTYTSGKFSARAGVRMDIVSAPDMGKFYIAPDIKLAVRTSLLTVWLDCHGGTRLNSLSDMMAFSPYMAGINSAGMSHTKVDGTLGIRIGGARGLSGSVLGYYADVTKAAAISVINNNLALTSLNRKGFGFGFRLDYSMILLNLKAHGGVDFYPHSNDYIYPSTDCATFASKIGVSAAPIKNLNVGIDWEIRANRQYKQYYKDSNRGDYISMGDANNLSVDAVYRITPAFSAGFRLENLLCRRWELVPGVYSQRMNGLLTAQINF